MKVLFVISDEGDDYGAYNFQKKFDLNEFAAGMKPGEIKELSEEEYCCDVHLIEFKDVDPKFIEFVKEYMVTEDHSNYCNFFVVEG